MKMTLNNKYLVKIDGLHFPRVVVYKGNGFMIRQDFPLLLKCKVEEVIRQL